MERLPPETDEVLEYIGAAGEEYMTVVEVSEMLELSYEWVRWLLKGLRREGLLESRRSASGGYRLTEAGRDPKTVERVRARLRMRSLRKRRQGPSRRRSSSGRPSTRPGGGVELLEGALRKAGALRALLETQPRLELPELRGDPAPGLEVLRFIRRRRGVRRLNIMHHIGLRRSTLNQVLSFLRGSGLVKQNVRRRWVGVKMEPRELRRATTDFAFLDKLRLILWVGDQGVPALEEALEEDDTDELDEFEDDGWTFYLFTDTVRLVVYTMFDCKMRWDPTRPWWRDYGDQTVQGPDEVGELLLRGSDHVHGIPGEDERARLPPGEGDEPPGPGGDSRRSDTEGCEEDREGHSAEAGLGAGKGRCDAGDQSPEVRDAPRAPEAAA